MIERKKLVQNTASRLSYHIRAWARAMGWRHWWDPIALHRGWSLVSIPFFSCDGVQWPFGFVLGFVMGFAFLSTRSAYNSFIVVSSQPARLGLYLRDDTQAGLHL